jgi:hypothetical protein
MVTMTEKKHEALKIESVMRRKSMNEIVLNAINFELNENTDEMLELLVMSYHFIKGGPAKELEGRLKKYAARYALVDDES